MAIIIISILCLLLTGCSNSNDLTKGLDLVFSSDSYNSVRCNNYCTYIDYYLPSDIFDVEGGNDVSSVFEIQDSKLILNVNVAGVIKKTSYDNYKIDDQGFFDSSRLVYTKNSSYKDENGSDVFYLYNLYQYDDYYLLYYSSNDINFYGYAIKDDVVLLTTKLFEIAHSCKIDEEKIIKDFSSSDIIDYQRKAVNLFETIMPLQGRIDEMMLDTDSSLPQE